MKSRQIMIAIVTLAITGYSAAAQPRKQQAQVEAPPMEGLLISTNPQSNAVLSDLIAANPEMPLGPQDLLKSYEIAMSLLAQRTAADFSLIVQTQQEDQISREQAEYLLLERYQLSIMQYQVLSALHDVLKHDIDEAAQQSNSALKTTRSDTVVTVPFPGSVPAYR